MTTPKVSIIVPVYNKTAYLPQCLDSILSQTLRGIEVITIDDASTDNSFAILREYAEKDERVKIKTHEKNKGIIQARKSGLIEADGDFVAFVDADDFAEPDMCATLYNKAIEKGADLIQCNARVYDPDKILSPELFRFYNNILSKGTACSFEGNDIFRRYAKPIRNSLVTSFINRRVYKKVIPYIRDNAPKRGDDDLLSFFFMFFASRYVFVNKTLYNYRANETSSNLNDISLELAKSQIEGRASAIQYAKWFIEENGIEWNNRERPFSVFSKALVKYSATFMDRYIESGGKEKEEVIRCFGDFFGGDALLYLMEKGAIAETLTGRNARLFNGLYAIYCSIHSMKLKAFLRWGFRKLKLY